MITQQLMNDEYFTKEKKLERKFAEIFAAWEIEKPPLNCMSIPFISAVGTAA